MLKSLQTCLENCYWWCCEERYCFDEEIAMYNPDDDIYYRKNYRQITNNDRVDENDEAEEVNEKSQMLPDLRNQCVGRNSVVREINGMDPSILTPEILAVFKKSKILNDHEEDSSLEPYASEKINSSVHKIEKNNIESEVVDLGSGPSKLDSVMFTTPSLVKVNEPNSSTLVVEPLISHELIINSNDSEIIDLKCDDFSNDIQTEEMSSRPSQSTIRKIGGTKVIKFINFTKQKIVNLLQKSRINDTPDLKSFNEEPIVNQLNAVDEEPIEIPENVIEDRVIAHDELNDEQNENEVNPALEPIADRDNNAMEPIPGGSNNLSVQNPLPIQYAAEIIEEYIDDSDIEDLDSNLLAPYQMMNKQVVLVDVHAPRSPPGSNTALSLAGASGSQNISDLQPPQSLLKPPVTELSFIEDGDEHEMIMRKQLVVPNKKSKLVAPQPNYDEILEAPLESDNFIPLQAKEEGENVLPEPIPPMGNPRNIAVSQIINLMYSAKRKMVKVLQKSRNHLTGGPNSCRGQSAVNRSEEEMEMQNLPVIDEVIPMPHNSLEVDQDEEPIAIPEKVIEDKVTAHDEQDDVGE